MGDGDIYKCKCGALNSVLWQLDFNGLEYCHACDDALIGVPLVGKMLEYEQFYYVADQLIHVSKLTPFQREKIGLEVNTLERAYAFEVG